MLTNGTNAKNRRFRSQHPQSTEEIGEEMTRIEEMKVPRKYRHATKKP